MSRPSQQRAGFTLTEILVALLIVATLAGISFPLVRAGMRSAHRATCLSNLRQIGVGVELYTQDHGQRMPDLATGRDSKDEDKDVIENTLDEYLENPEVFHCPADEGEFEATGSSYGWNPVVSGRRLGRLEFFGSDETESIPLVYDKENWHESGEENGTNILYANWTTTNEINFSIDDE
ncbi:type II secretion system protein [Haloferula sargassicola]|uniref:Prepilin-type N-terminal cleavage/methylation domain-containing protein n=1 Tax=Haloferula sargassicola TaxID=490096 RepID=A0ABP9UMH4_9BACT